MSDWTRAVPDMLPEHRYADELANALYNADEMLWALRRAEAALQECDSAIHDDYAERVITAVGRAVEQQRKLQGLHHDMCAREQRSEDDDDTPSSEWLWPDQSALDDMRYHAALEDGDVL